MLPTFESTCIPLPLLSFYLVLSITFHIWLLSDLSRNIMRGIALALGGSPNEFEGKRAGDAFWVMRIIGYPVISSANGQEMLKNDIGW